MAQEAGGLPYASPNTEGIGAVYFDKTVDPLTLHLSNLKQLDEGQRRREAAKKDQLNLTAKLVGDINPDTKGIFDTDGGYFQEKTKQLYDKYSQVLSQGYHPENPAFNEIYGKMQYEKKALENDVQVSKAQKELFTKLMGALAADGGKKYDLEKTNANIARFRMQPFEERKTMDLSKLLVPAKGNVPTLDWMAQQLKSKDNVLAKTTKQVPITHPDGTKGYMETTEWTDIAPKQNADGTWTDGGDIQKHAANMANVPERVEVAVEEMGKLPDGQQEEIKRQADMRGVNPAQVYFEQTLRRVNTRAEKAHEGKFDPYYVQGAKLWGQRQKDADSARYLAEQLDALSRGEVNVYGPENVGYTFDVFAGKAPERNQVKYSDALTNISAGKYPAQVIDDYGNPIPGKKEAKDNLIYGWKFVNGKLKVKTSQSSAKMKVKSSDGSDIEVPVYDNKYNPADEEGYIDVNDGIITSIAIANGVKPEAVRQGLIDMQKYGSGANVPTFTKPTATNPVAGGQQTQAKPQTKPAGGKVTTAAKIKSLVGTKGYEGYTEKELMDYYKSQGYEIK